MDHNLDDTGQYGIRLPALMLLVSARFWKVIWHTDPHRTTTALPPTDPYITSHCSCSCLGHAIGGLDVSSLTPNMLGAVVLFHAMRQADEQAPSQVRDERCLHVDRWLVGTQIWD